MNMLVKFGTSSLLMGGGDTFRGTASLQRKAMWIITHEHGDHLSQLSPTGLNTHLE